MKLKKKLTFLSPISDMVLAHSGGAREHKGFTEVGERRTKLSVAKKVVVDCSTQPHPRLNPEKTHREVARRRRTEKLREVLLQSVAEKPHEENAWRSPEKIFCSQPPHGKEEKRK